MKLTEHFNVEEFTRSDVASRYRIDNSLSPDNPNHAAIICNLFALCENVLEPLRQWYDKPITISSGYRCRELNSHPAIGGSSRSQHMTGEAADLHMLYVDEDVTAKPMLHSYAPNTQQLLKITN